MLTSSTITFLILAVTIFVSWSAFNRSDLFEKFLHSPYRVKHYKEYYRILSHTLIHADFIHLAFNMYALYAFGGFVEIYFKLHWGSGLGSLLYLLLYVSSAVVATLPSLKKHSDNYGYNSVGASGAVSAILLCYMILNPTAQILLLFIPMPAFVAVFVFFIFEHIMSRSGKTNIAHDAHIWGALSGITFLFIFHPQSMIHFIGTVRNLIF
ncbi:MAG: rhomboid family intramembrane serine protease [Flavobacteriales bacterium]|nr:rhomboid family intramembrane serine protease [Flavobacteriales bacterium]